MNLINFYKIYPDEAACEHALKEFRESHTLYNPECGGLHLSWNPSHKSWDMYGLRPRDHALFLDSNARQQTSGFRLVRGHVPDGKHQAFHISPGGTASAWKETLPAGLGDDAQAA